MKTFAAHSIRTISTRTITNAVVAAFLLVSGITTFAQSAAPYATADLEVVAFARTSDAKTFEDPSQVWADSGFVYVTDAVDSTVRMISLADGAVVTLGGKPGEAAAIDGSGSASRFGRPAGVWADGRNVYVSDAYFDTIRRISLTTGEVTTLAGSSDSPSGSDDGIGVLARFRAPQGIWGDGVNLYVTDSLNFTIRRIVIATGEVTTIAGTAKARGVDNGFGAFARFYAPSDVWGDGTSLYVADGSAIRRVVIATGEVTTIAGQASQPSYADGKGTNARFNFISGLSGNGSTLFVADSRNQVIRRVSLKTGAVTTVLGSASKTGTKDGPDKAARFNNPTDISGDGQSLFIADRLNSTIRRATAAAILTTSVSAAQ